MSLEISVYAEDLPEDLREGWQGTLAQHGFTLELYPAFEAPSWQGGFLPMSLRVPGDLPTAERYGNDPIFTGCEVDLRPVEAADRDPTGLPPAVAAVLAKAQIGIHFRSSAGRMVAEFRALVLSAGAVAHATGGALIDGQDAAFHVGAAALTYAIEAADRYEAMPDLREEEWQVSPFGSWEEYEQELKAMLEQMDGADLY